MSDPYEMVVLGQWPYQHTVTLSKLHKNSKIHTIYFVDTDEIISYEKAVDLVSTGHVLDPIMYTVMSEDMNGYVAGYKEQMFAPPIPIENRRLLYNNMDPMFREADEKVQKSAAILIANGQNRDIMLDLGAEWNAALGFWIIDVRHLQTLREKRRDLFDGKVYYEMYHDYMIKVWGDVTSHIELLKSVGATYNEQDNVWFIRLSQFDEIQHILTKS